jgi:hypothetical protein
VEDVTDGLSERRVEDDIIAAVDMGVSAAHLETTRRVWLEWVKDDRDNREVIGEILK